MPNLSCCGLKRRRGFVDPIPSSFPSTNQTKPRLSWRLVMPRCEDDGDSYRLPTWLADDMSSQFWEDLEVDDWFRRAGIAEFVATFFFLYITILTVIGVVSPAASEPPWASRASLGLSAA
ncbi:hypothetical protein B296_00011132 [Ensete ventricosum]|uniref:Uncharacterized protein n=1 Tax=Ensete ventricosum TaxID=4639 RepID=A0A427A6B0_ENSVE|nr:hypothetical protein B296_00011132 [Ensete ventricosum]